MRRSLLCIAGTLFSLLIQALSARAQGTSFTYQGRLNDNGNPAGGTYNLAFSLYPTNTVTGVQLAAGSTSWATLSDRNAKKDFRPVDPRTILDKLATVPIEQWHYKWESASDVPNIGPMAQDFKHAFYPGRDDKSITTLEFDGVELAAIQGLNEKLETARSENASLKQELDELKSEVRLLEERVGKQ
ncbi:MAG TPA: tail fiber domain-containing protein [Verrucomicrobiae bacterium]|nr:tail fiber domain-containing protein [Verrucomicrobiae bacterium]